MKTTITASTLFSALALVLAPEAIDAHRFGLPFVKVQNGSGIFRHFRNGQEVTLGLPLDGDRAVHPGTVHGADASYLADGAEALPGLASLTEWEKVFKAKFEVNALSIKEKFPKQEVAKIPWPSGDWPVYLDGINRKWNPKEPSAPAKYAMAKGLDLQEFEHAVSYDGGLVQAQTMDHGGSCTNDDDCAKEPYLYLCGKASDAAQGLCTPRYFGICDGWTSASLMEEEPKCPVTINDVTFRVLDIKALLSHVYSASNYSYTYSGALCPNDRNDALDEFGRYVDPARRDVDPHVFHILLANVIGRFRKSLILDIDAGVPTFNYALRSYSIQESRMMQPNDGASTFFKISSYNVFNPDAVQLQYVKMSVKYIHEGYEDGPLVSNPKAINSATQELVYEYLLELDASNQIIGGEWVNDSKKQHPDIVWYAYSQAPSDSQTNIGITYEFVSDLLKKSLKGSC